MHIKHELDQYLTNLDTKELQVVNGHGREVIEPELSISKLGNQLDRDVLWQASE